MSGETPTADVHDAPVVLTCPHDGCGWTAQFDPTTAYEREARKVDAALHYVDEHGGQIPDRANFGAHQCPACDDILGLDGTVSCSECGFIPEGDRA